MMHKYEILPLTNRVLVRVETIDENSKEGIFIPDTVKGSPQKGTVLAVGNGKNGKPMTVKIGDSVIYEKYTGTRITVEGAEALIMKEKNIYGIIKSIE